MRAYGRGYRRRCGRRTTCLSKSPERPWLHCSSVPAKRVRSFGDSVMAPPHTTHRRDRLTSNRNHSQRTQSALDLDVHERCHDCAGHQALQVSTETHTVFIFYTRVRSLPIGTANSSRSTVLVHGPSYPPRCIILSQARDKEESPHSSPHSSAAYVYETPVDTMPRVH